MPKKKTKGATKKISKKELLQSVKGMKDILPQEWSAREKVHQKSIEILEFYGFARLETPLVEKKDLFVRTVGENTDIVEKEMYEVRANRKGGLVLRPEVTASVVRSYLEHGMHKLPQPQKFYYIGPIFRHDKPQAGRYRQFWQIGAEVLGGESDPIYDVNVIVAFYNILEALKVGDIGIKINSIGGTSDRQNYKKKLVEYYKKHTKDLCDDCKRRLKANPLRLLDCKNKKCTPIKDEAPIILDSLSTASKTHFKQVLELLDEVGVPYTLDPYLVRGLDYYNKTVFEVFLNDEEKGDLALLGGGRYDYLSELIGGRSVSGMGAAMGVERVVEILLEKNPDFGAPRARKNVYLVHVGQLAKKKSISLLEELRKGGIPVLSNLGKSSLSNQLEAANKAGSSLALILGQKEVFEESIIIRDMKTGTQETVPLNKVVKEVKKKLK